MDAKTAREQALSITEGKAHIQYTNVMDCIKSAVNHGKFEARFYSIILPAVRMKLKQDGYTIEIINDQRDGITVIISW